MAADDNREEITKRAAKIRERLSVAMPEPKCELAFGDAWQLLVATILSARSTDKLVNTVTPGLFELYPTPKDLGDAPLEDVERAVKSTGFFRNKAKAIKGASAMIAERFGGEMPRTMAEAVELPGVARKTANLVLGTAYRISTGIIVDTHVARVALRLGLTTQSEPEKVEQDLCAVFTKRTWIDMSHRFILHGRYVCTNKHPSCTHCPLGELCPSADGATEGSWKTRAQREGAYIDSRGETAL